MNWSSLSKYAPQALAVLRVVTALLFILHGTQKLFGWPASAMPMGEGGLPPLMVVAALIELVGGLLVLVGFFTRPVAFILAGEMAVAYFIGHVPMGGLIPTSNFGDAAVLFCFIFLYIFLAGPGAWSLDASRNKAMA